MKLSRHQSDGVLAIVSSGLRNHGYAVGPSCVSSIGQVLDGDRAFLVRNRIDHRVMIGP